MNLYDDLSRWEAGELSREELLDMLVTSEKNLERNLSTMFRGTERDFPAPALDSSER